MAAGPEKKGKEPKGSQSDPSAEIYKLKTQAVDDLVTADEGNSPPVSKEDLERYGARKRSGIPNWLKVNFIKFWFPGSVCLFMIMALNLRGMENHVLIVGIVNGMVTDLLTNNVLRTMAVTDGGNDRWMMFPKARYSSFVFNILYAMVICLVVEFLYLGADRLVNLIAGTRGVGYLQVESVTYGIFYVLTDTVFLTIKHLIVKLFSSRKNSNV